MDIRATRVIHSLFRRRQSSTTDPEELPEGSQGKSTVKSGAAICSSDAGANEASIQQLVSSVQVVSNVPIKKLPSELLACIFNACVDLDCSPLILALVCHQWRSITLETRTLWRYILVADTTRHLPRQTSGSISGFDGSFMLGKKQICVTKKQLDMAIARAGSLTLDVTVNFTNNIFYGAQGDSCAINMCLSVFGDQGIITRTANLSITTLPNLPASHSAWTKLCKSSYMLTTFSCFSIGDKWVPFIRQMLCSSHMLASVELSCSLQDEFTGIRIWSGLKRFSVVQRSMLRTLPSSKSATDIILSKCHSIEEIVLDMTTWPNATTSMVNYKKLRYAQLRTEMGFLVRLHAPLLTFLSLYEIPARNRQWLESNQVELPSLKTLVVNTNNPRWIYESKLPSLVSLTMTLGRLGACPTNLLFTPNRLKGVLNITIEYFEADSAAIPALESVPNVQMIKIIPTGGSVTTEHLAIDVLQRLYAIEPHIIVPRAQYIHIGNGKVDIRCSRRIVEPFLRRVAATRKQYGIPLKSLTVHWNGVARIESVAEPSVVEYA